ncbi:TetR/AcrR family transcriptional regulator [Kribbella sandramycini]|uniref:AcrR family transcriptional regulator n=1 Tax=Kribbella sandramycini TaxID=60450 RepID=A0A7Y4NXW0_9ACTN|nr:TetR/AcrR family transcriptional regulator [Kribbella sandramycini]MBB6569883.1 AcrR family transcriptional regulator [Kribbella sandramycini]NOL40292.1 TetR/AcrR family transcriptional regulator [Kribbella sandramycini]
MTDRRTQLLQATIAVIARRGVRGMRVQEVAADAGVSVTLLYHYFGSREGLLEAALEAVSDQAGRYGERAAAGATSARAELVARLVGELSGTDEVQVNSAAWGELRWASVFDERLRPAVHKLTAEWVDEIAELVQRVHTEEGTDGGEHASAIAERLVALVEGLSGRWLTGAVEPDHLRELLAGAIAIELPAR